MRNKIICFLFIFCLACNKPVTVGYHIIGNVQNVPVKYIYLKILPSVFMRTAEDYNNKYLDIVDSAAVVDGHFEFHSRSALDETMDANLCYKQLGQLKYLIFSSGKFKVPDFKLENTTIRINGDDPSNVEISGAKETEISLKYGICSPSEQYYKVRSNLRKAENSANPTLIKTLSIQLEQQQQQYFQKVKSIVIENPNSGVVNGYIYSWRNFLNPNQVQQLTRYQDKKMWESPTGVMIKYYLKQGNLLLPGNKFPTFSLADSTNRRYNLDEVKGKKLTLVVFWSSSCLPCRQEIPELKVLYKKFKSKGLKLISISLDYRKDYWKKALKVEKMTWINISNLPKKYNEIQERYQCNVIPMMYLLDNQNVIVMAREYELKKIKVRIEGQLK